jgi:RimJ/RimL family protein N-acetyltransferase
VRIDWAKNYPSFKRLVISHRDGNEASRRANQAFGFKFIGKELIEWPDGGKAFDHTYELDLNLLRGN